MKIIYRDTYDSIVAAAIYSFPIYCMSESRSDLIISNEKQSQINEFEKKSIFINYDSISNDDLLKAISGQDAIIFGVVTNSKNEKLLTDIVNTAYSVTIFDCTKWTSEFISSRNNDYINKIKYIIDPESCLSELVWKEVISKNCEIPKFIQYLKDYVHWTNKISETFTFICGLDGESIYDPYSDILYDVISDEVINNDLEDKFEGFPASRVTNKCISIMYTGRYIANFYARKKYEYCKKFGFVDSNVFDGISTLCVNWKVDNLNLSNYSLYCTFAYNGDVWSYKIFSNDPSIDCEKIVKKYGGTGRKNVAGFSLPYCLFGMRESDEKLLNH